MARLEVDKYEPLHKEFVHKPIVFVVDMINGFCKEGALADEAIMDIVPAQKEMMNILGGHNVAVCDFHSNKSREFKFFPPHCEMGTKEPMLIDELKENIDTYMFKDSTNAFVTTEFMEFWNEYEDEFEDVIIIGCCTDICIMQFALTLNAFFNEMGDEKHRVIVPADCVDTYNTGVVHDAYKYNDFALSTMFANGVTVVKNII